MTQTEKVHEIERVIDGARDKAHVILLGGHPDPDAIATRACKRNPRAVGSR
jgi:hypothetical protein